MVAGSGGTKMKSLQRVLHSMGLVVLHVEVRSQCHTRKERIGEDRQKMATIMMSFVNLSQPRITWEESQQGTAYQAGLWACLWHCPDHSGGCGKIHVSTIPCCWALDRTKQRK